MMLRSALVAALVLLPVGGAMAACPPGTRSVQETANRIVCIQQGVADDAAVRANQRQIQDLQNDWRQNQLQQRFRDLPRFDPPPPPPQQQQRWNN